MVKRQRHSQLSLGSTKHESMRMQSIYLCLVTSENPSLPCIHTHKPASMSPLITA